MRYQVTVNPKYVKTLVGKLVDINPKIYPGERPYFFRRVLLMGIEDFFLEIAHGDGKQQTINIHNVRQIVPCGFQELATPPAPYIPTPTQWKQLYPKAVIAKWNGICMAVPRGPQACTQGIRIGEPVVMLKKFYNEFVGRDSWLVGHCWCAAGEPRPQLERDSPIELP